MAAADDLENLIADSLSSVNTALEGEKKTTPGAAPSTTEEAVKEIQKGPDEKEDPQNEQFFNELAQSYQDEKFLAEIAKVLQATESAADIKPAGTSDEAGSGGWGDAETEDFLQGFMKSFESAVSTDDNFAKSLTTLMTSMLSNDLVCEPLTQIADALEPWLQSQPKLPAADRSRYEAQLSLYRKIIAIYKENPDPLPDAAREEVQKHLTELHTHGSPPDEVMQKITPKDAADGNESFEDFIKSTGLGDGFGQAEQDLLKKLTDNPEELTKVMQEMAKELGDGKSDEGCKTQ
mmetsp:Transcript_10370/g.23423  ORF Transcript_10370/g.23423 Transcript_10370/m.23423 type:complete len:292 (-) Transcript_10370:62-937(-)|eukprot:CAMPEP_0178440464 /NCGR_PEP_ID=MMETSP0689_2-20121128/36805_1 /TAXON_ID=160604 /ORGANISM="Amphidinium massartii, Strain CS-259" /LENGTH=291 /DNA_ID=CAMNT_0020063265 /DNA_START=22 /DNA_END=897 /DNA_ORIENTATION=+